MGELELSSALRALAQLNANAAGISARLQTLSDDTGPSEDGDDRSTMLKRHEDTSSVVQRGMKLMVRA